MIGIVDEIPEERLATIECEGEFLLFNSGDGYNLIPITEDNLFKVGISYFSFEEKSRMVEGVKVMVFKIHREDKAKVLGVVCDKIRRAWFNKRGESVISNAMIADFALKVMNFY